MLNRLPDHYPAWPEMLAQLGNPPARQVARVFRVSIDQARQWESSGQAPHAVCLAVWWLTPVGMHAIDAEVSRHAQLAHALARAYRADVDQLRAELARVVSLGDFGCANGPTWHTLHPAPARPAALRLVSG